MKNDVISAHFTIINNKSNVLSTNIHNTQNIIHTGGSKLLRLRKSILLFCIIIICTVFGLSLSGCVTLATVPVVSDAIDTVAPLLPEGDIEHYSCADFHSESLCEYGIGNYKDNVDRGFSMNFNKSQNQMFLKNRGLRGEDAPMYIARMKVGDLITMWNNLRDSCKQRFTQQKDMDIKQRNINRCLGYGFRIVIKGRENVYLKTGDYNAYSRTEQSLAYQNYEGDYNGVVIPKDDDEYSTSYFQKEYNELSDEAKSYVNIEEFAMNAEQIKQKKREQMIDFIDRYYLRSLPIGASVPELEPLVVDTLAHLNPELKVKAIVFNQKWIVDKNLKHKMRFAAITVEDPLNSTRTSVLGYLMILKMDNEGGGTYGEPYFDMMEQIRPVRHAIDLYKDDGYINIRKQANYSDRVMHYIDFNDENTLYYYHAADVFIPFSEE